MAGLDDLPKGGGGAKLPTKPLKATGGLDSLPGTTATKKPGESLGTKAKKVGGTALKLITQPLGAIQQATFRLGSGIGELVGPQGGGIGEATKEFGRGLKELGTAGYGQKDIDFAEATTPVKLREQGMVRKLPTGVNMAANILLDPLLPSAFSKTKDIAQATKVAESVLGKEGAEKLAQGGVKALAPAERASLEAGVAQKSLETAAHGGRRTLSEIAQGVKNPAKMTAQEGAERLVGKTIKGLEAADKAKPVTAIGRGAEALGEAGKGQVGKAVQAIKRTGFGEWLDDALKPRAGIERNWGKDLADAFKAEGDTRLARFGRRAGDLVTEVNARMAEVVKAGGNVTAEENQLLGAALRGEKWAQETIKDTRLADVYDYASKVEGKTGTMRGAAAPVEKAATAVKGAAQEVKPVAGESAPMAKLREILARQGTTPEALKAANEGRVVEAAKLPKSAAARVGGKMPEIGDANPLKDVLNRHLEMLHAEETGASLGRMKATITDPHTGEALLRQVARDEDLPEGWQRLQSKHWGGHAAPKEIAQEIDRVGHIIDDTTALGKMGKFVDTYDRIWKTSATSLPVNAAFTLRNARSNLFLNWLDGLYHLGPYKEAFRIQRKAGQVLKGDKFAAEIKAAGADAVLRKALTNREYKIFRLAQDNRVLGSNWFDIDASLRGTGKVRSVKGVREETSGVLSKAKQAGGNAAEAGRNFNGAVEDNARLANFIHNLDRTGDAKIAASHVHKYLFDYGDLTHIEQEKIKKLVPFYTFMRKNVPLQVASALKMPGKVGARIKIGEAVTEELPSGVPSYLERSGAVQVPGLAQALGAVGTVAFTPETPLTAAAQTIDPFAKLLTDLPAIATGDGEKLKEMPAEVWRPMVSLMGGARGAPLKVVFGEAGQRDLFSGAELPPEDVRLRAAQAMLPVIGRFLSTLPNEQKAEVLAHISQKKVTKEDKEALRTWLLRQAGIKVREVK
jgi:hypothetical protein